MPLPKGYSKDASGKLKYTGAKRSIQQQEADWKSIANSKSASAAEKAQARSALSEVDKYSRQEKYEKFEKEKRDKARAGKVGPVVEKKKMSIETEIKPGLPARRPPTIGPTPEAKARQKAAEERGSKMTIGPLPKDRRPTIGPRPGSKRTIGPRKKY